MKKISLFLCLVMLLSLCTSFALAEDLPELLTMDENSFLVWFRQFDPAADYSWAPWEWELDLENGVYLSGYLSDNGEIAAYLGYTNDEGEEAVHSLAKVLYAFPGTAEAFPDAEERLFSGETCDLFGGSMMLMLEDSISFNLGAFSLDPVTFSTGTPTLPEMVDLLEEAGFAIKHERKYKSYELSTENYYASVFVGNSGCLSSVDFEYYGSDPEAGKTFLTAAAALLNGPAGVSASALVQDNYDHLADEQVIDESISDYFLRLAKEGSPYLYIEIPDNAADTGAAVFPIDASTQEEPPLPAVPEDDGFSHTQETVLVDEAGIRFVALASSVRYETWGAPYIQFTMENNTDQLLHIELKGKINGYDISRIALQPATNNMPLDNIKPGETLSGNMLFRTNYYEYMDIGNVAELVVEPSFRLDQLDKRMENYELYYQGEPVTIPADGIYTPPADLPTVFELDQLRISAVALRPDEILSYESGYTSPCIVVLCSNSSERRYALYFTDVQINGRKVEDGQLNFLNSYEIEDNSNAFAMLYLKAQAMETLGNEELKTVSGTITGYSWTIGQNNRNENIEQLTPTPFSIDFN